MDDVSKRAELIKSSSALKAGIANPMLLCRKLKPSGKRQINYA